MSPAPRTRILSLTWANDRFTNAQQVNAREIAARLPSERFEITLLSDGSPARTADAPSVRLRELPPHGRAARILLLLLRGEFDLVLYPAPGWPEAVYLRLPRWWPGRSRTRVLAPVEGDVRQLEEVSARLRKRVERILRRADALVPISEHVAEGLRARYGRTGEVVPVGVNGEEFRPRDGPRTPGPPRVLSVGTVKSWKRPGLASAAARAIPEARFTWIGDGEDRRREAAKAPANLAFTGPCGREALPEQYRRADVLLHPSRMEGLPKVVLEAMSTGVPVVLFDDYRPRFVSDAGAGFVVRSEEEMIEAVRRLLADESLRERMGRAGTDAARSYSWDVVAARWAEIFEREGALARRR